MHLKAIERLAAKASSLHIGEYTVCCQTKVSQNHAVLPLRGYCEDVESFEGNLYQLLLLQSKDCPRMRVVTSKRIYFSSNHK